MIEREFLETVTKVVCNQFETWAKPNETLRKLRAVI